MLRQQYTASDQVPAYFGIRHLQCLLLFLGLGVGYAMRVNLSVAIVAMTDQSSNGTYTNYDSYLWNEQIKSYVLSSFFWGYVVTQIPAGQLADKYGPKLMLMCGILLSSILALLSPLITHFGNWQLFCFTRFLQGLSQGMLFPSTHAILSKWALLEERGGLCGFCYTGSIFGSFVMFTISGSIATSTLGWPGLFYIAGVMGLIWVLCWYIWGANKPADYKHITLYEKQLIECSLNQTNLKGGGSTAKLKTPWRKLFSTPAVWVLIFVHCAHNWGFWTLLTELPSYIKDVLGTDIKENALLAGLPYLAMTLLSFVFIFVSNKLAKTSKVSTAFNRKLLNTIGQFVPAVTLVILSYIDADSIFLAAFLLVLTVGLNSASFSGFQGNHIDLSPNFAGVLVGITNSAANVMSIIAPLVVGLVVTDEHNPAQWRLIFFIAAGFYFCGNLLFLIFGKADVQPWNESESPKGAVNIEMQRLRT